MKKLIPLSKEQLMSLNKERGLSYFSKDIMKEFSSCVYSYTTLISKGEETGFITREIDTDGDKSFSVRAINHETGCIRTISDELESLACYEQAEDWLMNFKMKEEL